MYVGQVASGVYQRVNGRACFRCGLGVGSGILRGVTTTTLDYAGIGPNDTATPTKRVLLLKPRGFCAGVVRAIDIVQIALETFGAPIYVRKEIVHNSYVVTDLAKKGAIFVNELDEVPEGARVIYSAHGVSPAVRQRAKERGLKVIDATCPLVTKVHLEAVKFSKQGYSLVLVGHRDHEEVEGTQGEAPDVTQVVSTVEEVAALVVPDPNKVAYLTQTTLSLDEARYMIDALKKKFPNIAGPGGAGHLLCDGEPPGCGEECGARRGPGAGGGIEEQLELEPAGGGLEESGHELLSDRLGGVDPAGVAGGREYGCRDGGRIGARGAGAGCGELSAGHGVWIGRRG